MLIQSKILQKISPLFSCQRKFEIRSVTSSYPYAAIVACLMGLIPQLTQRIPPSPPLLSSKLRNRRSFSDKLKGLSTKNFIYKQIIHPMLSFPKTNGMDKTYSNYFALHTKTLNQSK